jgi:hypothetical protein
MTCPVFFFFLNKKRPHFAEFLPRKNAFVKQPCATTNKLSPDWLTLVEVDPLGRRIADVHLNGVPAT